MVDEHNGSIQCNGVNPKYSTRSRQRRKKSAGWRGNDSQDPMPRALAALGRQPQSVRQGPGSRPTRKTSSGNAAQAVLARPGECPLSRCEQKTYGVRSRPGASAALLFGRRRREICDGFKGSLTGENRLLRATVRGLSLVPYSRVGPCYGSDDGSWLTVALAGVASQSPGKERRGRSALARGRMPVPNDRSVLTAGCGGSFSVQWLVGRRRTSSG